MRGVHYRLWVKPKSLSYQIVYSQGISPLFMKFEEIQSFEIEKTTYASFDSETFSLTRYFILFQRAWRKHRRILRKAFRALRARELGLPYSFD